MVLEKKRKVPFDAQPVPPVECDFKPGDVVIHTNDYGVKFRNTVVGFTPKVPEEGWEGFIYVDSDSWWFPLKPESLRLVETLDHSNQDSLRDARVDALDKLQYHAGAAYSLYQVATKALQAASGDASAVDWGRVHQDVLNKAVGQDKQPVAQVLNAIKLHSPGAVTPEQVAAVDAMDESRRMAFKPIQLGVYDGKPAVTWGRNGIAEKGEPPYVTEVKTYGSEKEQAAAFFQDTTGAEDVRCQDNDGLGI